MRVFFYGLFMDRTLLEAKGIKPLDLGAGFVDGMSLRIGERATLLQREGGRAYGIIMSLTAGEAETLYSEDSVSDYLPETVVVHLTNGGCEEAICYNLPESKTSGTNQKYAQLLLDLAIKLGLPDSYLDEIRAAG